MGKKALCLIFAFLLSINSFAAVVSDNDGSAFITKAEFDSLKNNFQSQLDSYNSGIDSKIDSAIAGYLAGITVTTAPEVLWSRVVTLNGGPVWFLNAIPGVGDNTININKKITLRRQLAALGEWTWTESWKYWSAGPSSHKYTDNPIIVLYAVAGENSTSIQDSSEYRIFQTRDEFAANNKGGDSGGTWDTSDAALTVVNPDGSWPGYSATMTTFWTRSSFPTSAGIVNTLKTNISMLKSSEESGSGVAWIYHLDPDGKAYLSNYATNVYPVMNIHAYVHNYQSFKVPASSSDSRGATAQNNFMLWYASDNGKAYPTTTTQEYTANLPNGYGYEVTANTTGKVIPADNSTTDNQYYLRVDLSKITTTNGIDYTSKQFGQGSTANIYCLRDIKMPTYSTSEYDDIEVTDLEWYDVYFTNKGQETQTNKMNDIKVKWKKVILSPEQHYIYDFSNSVLSSVAGQTVYNGGGVPLAKFVDDNSECNIKLKLKTSTGIGNITYMLSDEQFEGGAFSPSATVTLSGTIASGDEISFKRSFNKDKILWLNCYAATSGVEATVESFSIK